MSEFPLELHERPLYGPMVEVYAKQRAALTAELERRRAERDERSARHAGLLPEPEPAAAVCWRTLAGVSLCNEHALGLLDYGFVPDDFRPVWDEARVVEVAAQTGMSVSDIRRLHAHYFDERCSMCGVVPSANRCLNCDKNLHLNWPAVYCTNACAMEDA
jgi:hypothetical protein